LTGIGLHVPVIPGLLLEILGKTIGVEFWQSGAIGAKVGTTGGSITIVINAGSAH